MVRTPFRCLPALGLAAFLALISVAGCRAQVPAGTPLSPDLYRRVELLIRSKTKITRDYDVTIGNRTKSDVPGFDTIQVTFTADGKASGAVPFLLSSDGKTLAQFTKFDLSADPRTVVSAANRPARGGPATAPVTIVVYDDLECPFCARMHAQLFPALIERYHNQIHIVYKDFPLDQHPWAMRAAIDTNCVGALSTPGYWNLVDYIHLHASDFGGDEHSLAKANDALDKLARDQATLQKSDMAAVNACIAKQDSTPILASRNEAEKLTVEATPSLFINGEKIDGAVPITYVYKSIDSALTAAGIIPPPMPPAPVAPAAAPPTTQPPPKPPAQTKGN